MDLKTENAPQLELELYFLIAKFLSNGPCQTAYKVLRAEMAKHKLLSKRVDWDGQEHYRTFGNLVSMHSHIPSNYLLDICERLLCLVDQSSGLCPKGLNSLLGAGQFSVLRTEETFKHISWKSSSYLARRNGHPMRPPHNLQLLPSITTVLRNRDVMGAARTDLILSAQFYGKMSLLFRNLGHLSSVYCVLFDRTGHQLFTGSDDNLIKAWSATTGRLLCTFRGHAAEINDMAVSFDNRLLAVGSCDKLIRIWCLKTSAPVAILHGHTHMITSLRFSPYTKGSTNYLASTGGDGCLCIWEYNMKTNSFSSKPIKFVEKSRAGAQMLCLSFSAGGGFLATGSSDHVVRVYSLGGRIPEKICELESHNDRIDSVQYSNSDLRFVTGSRDGYARIWRYERQEWKAVVLSMAELDNTIPKNDDSGDWSLPQRKVTMVCWTVDDAFVLTAVSDFTIKVWNSSTGQLCHTLKGHSDEVFVLEPNPMDRRMLLSAGHDGNIFFWDVITGQKVRAFKNTIEGQGHGAVFDCKWSPDGQSFAATDSHGYLLYFGFGSNDKYKKLPEEIYFHTDYRPLVRDIHSNVLDEQTQVPPHMLPPPFLVDIDGNPHPPKYQRLVPGREDCNDTQLVPLVVVAPNGNREVVDDLTGELRAGALDEDLMLAGMVEEAAVENAVDRPIIDEMIARMQQEQDLQLMRNGNEPSALPSSSVDRVSTRSQSNVANNSADSRGADTESGLPSSSTNQQRVQGSNSSQQAPPSRANSPDVQDIQQPINMCIWKQRDLVKQLDEHAIRTFYESKVAQAEEERANFIMERKKKPILAIIQHLEDENDANNYARTRTMKQKRAKMLSMGRNEERGRNRLERRALYDTDESEQEASVVTEEEEELEEELSKDYSSRNNTKDHDSSDDSASTVYSNWSPDGRNFLPPTRQSRRNKKNMRGATLWNASGEHSESEEDTEVEMDATPEEKGRKLKGKMNGVSGAKNRSSKRNNASSLRKKVVDSSLDDNSNEAINVLEGMDDEGDDDNDGGGGGGGDSQDKRDKGHKAKSSLVQSKKGTSKFKQIPHHTSHHPQINGEVREVPPEFRPPEWLTSSMPHKTPYFPQMGDEVIYFLQGHQQYVEAVRASNAYQIDNARTILPWLKLPHLREQELMKVIGIKYEIRPPRLVCLKLAFIDPETSKLLGGSFTIKYHDMVGVIDFVVLRHTYNVAMGRNWNPGDNFRCLIDDAWWHGSILRHEPFQEEYPDSMFQCYVVQWDNGEQERLSPWDLEPVEPMRIPDAHGGNVSVTREELMAMRYPLDCKPQGWPRHGCEAECDRIVEGLERIMDLSIAEPFLVPVDLNAFPTYAMVIEYPIDLTLIKERLLNRFYRRLAAVQYDIRHIEANARAFNEPSSQIVKSAKIVTDLFLAFVSDPNCYDPMPLYNQMTQRTARNGVRSENDDESFLNETGETSSQAVARRKTRHARISERLRLNSVNNRNNWREQCLKLLDIIIRSQDSLPFQHPVDIIEFPDYLHIVQQPMDLSTIRNNLESGVYDNPNEFCRDVRLIFTNSRSYNTNKRSKIYVMTLRLSAMFEDQLKITLKGIKESKKESSGKTAAHLKAFSSFKKSGHSGSTNVTRLVGTSIPSLNSSGSGYLENSISEPATHNNNSAHVAGQSSSNHNRGTKRRRIESDDEESDEEEEEKENEIPEMDSIAAASASHGGKEERTLRSGAKLGDTEKNGRHQSKRPKVYDSVGESEEWRTKLEVVRSGINRNRDSGGKKKRKKKEEEEEEEEEKVNCIYKDDIEDEEGDEDDDDDDDGDQTSDADFRISSYHRRKQSGKAEKGEKKLKKNKSKNKKEKNKKKKRKNAYYEDDDDDDDEEEEEEEEEEDEDDAERNYRDKRVTRKRKRTSLDGLDSHGDRYGTRCSTGSIKRRRYDKEFEEDDLSISVENGIPRMPFDMSTASSEAAKRSLRSRQSQGGGNERSTKDPSASLGGSHGVLSVRLSRNGVEQSLAALQRNHIADGSKKCFEDESTKGSTTSNSKSSHRNGSESDTDDEVGGGNKVFRDKNCRMASSTSGSTEKNNATDEEDDDDDDSDEDDTDGSDTETYSNRSGPSNKGLRSRANLPNSSAGRVRHRKGNSPKVRAGYRTRSQGRRTIQYAEHDEEEEEDKGTAGVSSRGRPQKPNVRLTSMIRH